MKLREGQGTIDIDAALNTLTEVYKADLKINNLQLHNFLPKDSIYELSLSADAEGRGLDVTSYRSFAKLNLSLDQLDLTGALKGALVTARLASDNALLKMTTEAEYNLAHSYPDGKVTMDVTQLDLHELGLMPQPMKHPLAFNFSAEARQNRVYLRTPNG